MLSTAAAGPAAVRGGALRIGAFVAGSLISVIGISLLLRHLGPGGTEHYVVALSLTAIVAAISDLGLTAVGVRELAIRPHEERWSLARDLLGLRITLTLVGGVAVTVFALLAYSTALGLGVALASVGLLLQVTQDNVALPLLLDLRLGRIAVLEFLRPVLVTVFTAALVLAGAGFVAFLGMTIPVSAIVLGVAYAFVRGVRSLAPTFSLRRWRKFTRAMLPYSVAVAASALYFRVSILLVAALSNETQGGYFAASFRIIEVLTAVPTLLVSSAFPIFARAAQGDHDRLGYAVGRVFEVSLIVGAWTAVSIAVGAPLALAVIGGPKFSGADSVLAIQGVALGAVFVSLVWANALLSLGLFRQILLLNVAALLLNTALVTALVPADGARGAAIATAIAEIVLAAIQAAAVIHHRPNMRPSLRGVPFVAIAAAAGLLPLAFNGVPTVVRLVISTALFAVVIIVTHAYPPELLDVLPWRPGRDKTQAVQP